MNFVLANGTVFVDGVFSKKNVFVENGVITEVSDKIPPVGIRVYNCENLYIFPGFIDVHVHLREPGFFYKETIETGTKAAAAGGYTTVCSMPNLNPVPDSVENLKMQTDIIEKSAKINVYPYGAITVSEKGETLSDMEGMCSNVCGFSDDGRGVQNDGMMKEAMTKAKKLDKIIAAHCEDNSLLMGGYIHKGEYAEIHNHKGICSEGEYKQIERDLKLAECTGVKYHVCHISTKESVSVIREAKKRGVDVTSETGPHYLVFNDMMLKEEGRFKMNPPIRSEEDRLALIEGIKDGTIDMIATDHAPHSKEEKSKGLSGSLMGVVGLETAFSVMYTHFVETGVITLEKLVSLLNTNARNRFGIGSEIKAGNPCDIAVFDLEKSWIVNPEKFESMGKSTPFENMELKGKCVYTFCGKTKFIMDKSEC